jgi:hypothetical protein
MFASESQAALIGAETHEGVAESLEAFSRDLLVLVKTLSVYPEGHPAMRRVATRLAGTRPVRDTPPCTIGITPTRVLYGNEFFGTSGSRVEALAALLHSKKIMRLHWGSDVTPEDITAFSSLLSGRSADGRDLADSLVATGVHAIAIEPLDASKIHGALSLDDVGAPDPQTASDRGLNTWIWLQDNAFSPELLAQALRADTFWTASEQDPLFAVRVLLQDGEKLDQALNLLSDPERTRVREGLVSAGRAYPVADLASIVMMEVQGRNPANQGLSHLLRGLSSEDLLELMARVVAQAGDSGSRAMAFLWRVAPQFETSELLSRIEARQGQPEGATHPVEVWRNLKTFLLDAEEGKFFGDDYALDLQEMAQEQRPTEDVPHTLSEFSADLEPHLDAVHLGMARDQSEGALLRLEQRLGARVPQLPAAALLRFATETHRLLPDFFAGRPELVRAIFSKALANARASDPEQNRAAIEFAKSQESEVLDLALTALIRERRIAGRRFLVDLLSELSPRTTEHMLSRASEAPWYYLRNVITVLGRRGERDSTPILEALLEHPHDRVRREALKALGKIGGAARRAVQRFASASGRTAEERRLAERLLATKEVVA